MKITDAKFGTLIIHSVHERMELLAAPVASMLSENFANSDIAVCEIDPDLSDTAAFCQHYQIQMAQAANCVILEAKRADKTWYAACLILANTKADVNGLARRILDARKVSFAAMTEAVMKTGMEYGAITPIGLPRDWTILIDKAVVESQRVVIGSGIRKSKIVVSGDILRRLPNVQVVDGLGKTSI